MRIVLISAPRATVHFIEFSRFFFVDLNNEHIQDCTHVQDDLRLSCWHLLAHIFLHDPDSYQQRNCHEVIQTKSKSSYIVYVSAPDKKE